MKIIDNALRSGRVPGLRTAKSTLGAVLAYVVADLLGTSAAPILAALTALLVVQVTVYETVATGVQRMFSVLAGVLVAVAIATFVGLHWWSLGAVVALSLIIGVYLRLGSNLVEAPISAMLVLAVGSIGAESAAINRVYETLVGAVVGIAVNFAIAPPVHVRPAGEAIGQVANRLAEFLRELAGDLRVGWSRAAAQRRLEEARALGPDVAKAEKSVVRAEQSALLNPRGAEVREAQPRLRTAMTGIELWYILLRTLCREIFDRTFYLPPEKEIEAYGPQARAALADVLERAAAAMCGVAAVAGGDDDARAQVHESLTALHARREHLGRLLLVDPHVDAAAWQQHGALLAVIDRMRVEIEAAVRPAAEPWRPPLLTERPKQAVRRMIDVAAEAATNAAAAAEASARDLKSLRRLMPDAEPERVREAADEVADAAALARSAADAAERAARTAAEEAAPLTGPERPDPTGDADRR
ncbi:hypothetical protein Val02_05800 [Virgisporangium aliadipatigenens]|uniref:FUSC family protein n=1 Tax=Virgisporangium aliadipatigenens TaxID=741659 RepID=A0A8J3YEJ4_9ACTN|nr:aromatic acid exporter family protein [Virgisporangium aliadipatigenens]GIJ43694.1 hypothetical protein Val02_05800 [Virgisporangium aliadipatigenens]